MEGIYRESPVAIASGSAGGRKGEDSEEDTCFSRYCFKLILADSVVVNEM